MQRELVEALGDLTADSQDGGILQVNSDTRKVGQLRTEALDDLVDQLGTLSAGLQVSHDHAYVGSAKHSSLCTANSGHKRLDGRVAINDVGYRFLVGGHCCETGALSRFGGDLQLVRVLIG